ncbi:hypothetical protein HX109_07540 [Galbibacter sp. BG1]|uniref:YciI-like protein n=1 Tax=Galbibacter sp. BG1 TaxID=1170699 RepID=UPI0015B7FE24|nr:YciI-like protein [Galbibacter sp. BG1]QLE01422.1 hypothetical protein HX109_07540 [Galbibacter sp. BG1]
MNYYVLNYKTADDYLEKRPKYREEHLELAQEYLDKGFLVLGGAMDNPADEALLIFKCESEVEVKSFVAKDPYVKNGLVKEWKIRKWNVVIEKN